MRRAGLTLLLGALLATNPAGAQTSAPAAVVSVAAEQTQFRLTLADGRMLRSLDLIGAKLTVSTENGIVKVRVAVVEKDPAAQQSEVWRHTFMVQQPDQFDVVCTADARAKCVRFGYRPWVPEEIVPYNACTRMVRGDYGGLGNGTTRNGMPIDNYDGDGIQKLELDDPKIDFEAGWTPRGAVCVRPVRVKENTSLAALEAAFPQLKRRRGAVCTEALVRSLAATLFNRSAP